MRNTLILFLTLVTVVASAQNYSDAIDASRKEVQGILDEYPGASIAIGVGSEIVWSEGIGYADAESKTMATPEHRFYYYSLSKSIIGIAMYQLVENGVVDLDKPVIEYDESLPAHYADVTIRTLLNHTAGVRHYNKGEWMKISMDNCERPVDAIATFINDPLNSTPGTKHSYSSFGYVLLSHLLEVITGETFDEHIEKEVFTKRSIEGIVRSRGPELITMQTTRYEKWNAKKVKGKAAEVDNSCKFGGGSFIGTPSAFAKLHMQVLAEEKGKDGNNLYSSLNPDLRHYTYGLGVNTSEQGVTYYIHTGSGMGGSTILLIYPAYDLTIVIMGNIQADGIKEIVGNIGNHFIKALEE